MAWIHSESLSYWPYRYLKDDDSDDIIRLFEKIIQSGKNLSIQAHFNHPVELSTDAVRKAISRIRLVVILNKEAFQCVYT